MFFSYVCHRFSWTLCLLYKVHYRIRACEFSLQQHKKKLFQNRTQLQKNKIKFWTINIELQSTQIIYIGEQRKILSEREKQTINVRIERSFCVQTVNVRTVFLYTHTYKYVSAFIFFLKLKFLYRFESCSPWSPSPCKMERMCETGCENGLEWRMCAQWLNM